MSEATVSGIRRKTIRSNTSPIKEIKRRAYERGLPGWLGFRELASPKFPFLKDFDVSIQEGGQARLPRSRFLQPKSR